MHRLILLRHAKAAWPSGVADVKRPLADRGRSDAAVAAQLIATELPAPDLVLCSPALRTRQTWELAGANLDPAPDLTIEPVIYGAAADEITVLLQRLPETTGTALVVGHQPTMSRTALDLAGPGSDGPGLTRLAHKFPTCGIAVLFIAGAWAGLGPGSAVLERFVVPRAQQVP